MVHNKPPKKVAKVMNSKEDMFASGAVEADIDDDQMADGQVSASNKKSVVSLMHSYNKPEKHQGIKYNPK